MPRQSSLIAFLNKLLRNRKAGYAMAIFCIAAVIAVLEPIHQQITAVTVALALLMSVLFIATLWGSRPALLASVLGVLSFNYFFLPPVGTWTISDAENWFALVAFLITAVIAGQLSAHAKRRAEIAEFRRLEIERLYEKLIAAFERESRAQAIKQSERLKSALLDAVTHDIRTPLTSIKASVTTLLDELSEDKDKDFQIVLDEESRLEMLEIIDEETDRLNRFVEDLIELARIEAGEVKLRRQSNAVEEIVSSGLERAKSLLGEHKISIDIEKKLPPVCVDSQAISEIVYNLVDNAAKYSPAGTTIRISAEKKDEKSIVVAVEDEGAGIAPELRERVFEKFFRAIHDTESGASRQPAGTGMGLSIAKGIVEAHDGQIRVTDALHNETGSRFEFVLPIE